MPQQSSDKSSSNNEPIQTGTPSGVPLKFDQNGIVQPFAGNTIISHVPLDKPLQKPLGGLYKELEAHNTSPHFALLPNQSYHMTIFEGICDKIRKPQKWPHDLPLNASLDDAKAFFTQRLQNFDLGFAPPIRMTVVGFRSLRDGVSLKLDPVDQETEARLRGLRDRFADALGLKMPKHETYEFHLSISYLVRWLSAEQEEAVLAILERWRGMLPPEVELGVPEFCVFEDMSKYTRLFYIN